jgi:hypothetical protein
MAGLYQLFERRQAELDSTREQAVLLHLADESAARDAQDTGSLRLIASRSRHRLDEPLTFFFFEPGGPDEVTHRMGRLLHSQTA